MQIATGGGGGDIGKSVNFGGGDGGDDDGDDDDYFDEFDDDDDGDEGGLFRRRMFLAEVRDPYEFLLPWCHSSNNICVFFFFLSFLIGSLLMLC